MPTKNALFIDLDRSIFGTFIKELPGQEPEHVKPIFCPSGFFPREVTYDIEIPKNCIYRYGGRGTFPGTENQVYCVLGSKRDSDFNIVKMTEQKMIEELKDKIRELELDVSGKQVQVEKAMGGLEQTQASIKKLEEVKKRPNPFGDYSSEFNNL
jgi:hypothetical protein